MPATPTYALRYPALSDSPNGPAQFQALAEDVEDELVRIDAAAASNTANIATNTSGVTALAHRMTRCTADTSNTSNSVYVVPTGFNVFPLGAGLTYQYRYHLYVTTALVTTGYRARISFTGTVTRTRGSSDYHGTAGVYSLGTSSAFPQTYFYTSSDGNFTRLLVVEGMIQVNGAGNFSFDFASEVNTSSVSTTEGSFGTMDLATIV